MDKWMSVKVKDQQKLCDIVIPGSHDSGMYVHRDLNGAVKSNPSTGIITHKKTILEQLQSGYRMFDLRIYNSKQGILYCGHFPEKKILGGGRGKTDKWGGLGESLQKVLYQVYQFLSSEGCGRETVILKFSHIQGNNTRPVLHVVTDSLKKKLYTVIGTQTIGAIPFVSLRGRVLAVFDKFDEALARANSNIAISCNNLKGSNSWTPRLNHGDKTKKLILRGSYANRRTRKAVFSNQKKKMRNWYINGWQTNYPGELMQLYWTSTNNETELWTHPNVEVNTDRIWDRAGRRDLKYLIGNFRPNIVITDFAERRKAKYILKHAYWAFPV